MDAIIYDKIDEVQGKVEYNGGGINALKQDTAALLAKGVVKSVQHGVFAFTESTEQHITIAPVDLDKAVLIVDIGGTEDVVYGTQYMSVMYAYLASSTGITIETPAPYAGFPDFRASWQVIEFY